MRKHVFVATTDDEPGVLNRVASLFRRRAFNIHSLTVGPASQPGLSRMTLVVETDDLGARRVQAHLEKLVNVLRVENLTEQPSVVRDLALIRVRTAADSRTQVLQLAQTFRANIVDVSEDSVVVECVGSPAKISALVAVLRPFGVMELGHTGAVAMGRRSVTGFAEVTDTEPETLEALSA